MYTVLLILISWNLEIFPNISVNLECKKMVDHILEILRLLVFSIKCLNCETTKLYLRKNPPWI